MKAARAPRRGPSRRLKTTAKHAGDDGNIEAGDGDDVRGPGVVESLLDARGQTRIDAQEDARQQRCLGIEEQAVDVVKGRCPEPVRPPEGAAAFPGKQCHLWMAHVAADTDTRQVIAVREVLARGRGHQRAAQAQDVAVVVVLIRAHAGEEQAAHLDLIQAVVHRLSLQTQISVGVADIGRHQPVAGNQHVIAAVIEPSPASKRRPGARSIDSGQRRTARPRGRRGPATEQDGGRAKVILPRRGVETAGRERRARVSPARASKPRPSQM